MNGTVLSGDIKFAVETYLRAKSLWRRTKQEQRRSIRNEVPGVPFSEGRDPKIVGDVLTGVAKEMGWDTELERAKLISEWSEFVGAATAEHTRVIGIRDDVFHVHCDSTAWATELRRLRAEIFTRILHEYPDAGICEMRFFAPWAPTWRHGPRTVSGRGPRDTYG